MSTPWAQGVTLTSTSADSPSIGLDPLSKMTAVQVTFSSTATYPIYVQATLDGNGAWQSGGAGGVLPTPQPLWGNVGSSAGILASGSTNASGTPVLAFDGTLSFVLLQPVAGLRLASSAAGVVPSGVTAYLRALQSPTA